MSIARRGWRRLRARLLGGLAVPLLVPMIPQLWAEEGVNGTLAVPMLPAAAVAPAAQVQTLSLAECLQLALERQPAIAAQRASLAAAETNRRALENVKVPAFIVRELPFRREQATLGVTVASAKLEQVERETTYSVTRLYYTVIYAREQKKVTDDVVEHLKATLETAKALVKGGSKDVTTSTVDKITVYQRLAETRQADAARGIERATAALREAIGLDPCCCLRVPEDTLPEPKLQICRDEIVDLAIARRGELTQAITFSEVTRLEEKAQGTKFFRPTSTTFSSVSDIHASSIPGASFDRNYRPGAVSPEMPTMLVGSRHYRMERARDFYARSADVIDKTRNLVALEAEDAYLEWEEASRKVPQTQEAAEKGRKLAEDTSNDFKAQQKVKAEDVLANEVLAAQARAQHNEARHQLVLALAALERVTAGGFCAGLAGPARP